MAHISAFGFINMKAIESCVKNNTFIRHRIKEALEKW
jgi:hypothetical protein